MSENLSPTQQLRLMDENLASYRKLMKDMEFRAVMARLQGKIYSQEMLVINARDHIQRLEARRQKFLQQNPHLFVREREDNGVEDSKRDRRPDKDLS